jgi:hypothetical protein
LARSSFYLFSRKRPSTLKLQQKIVELSEQHPRCNSSIRPNRAGRCGSFTLIDEYSKQALAIHAGYSIRTVDAITVLEAGR